MALAALALSSPAFAGFHGEKIAVTGSTSAKQPVAPAAAKNADVHVFIQLSGPAAVMSYAAALPSGSGASRSSATPGAIAAGRSQIASNKAQQAAFVGAMQAAGIKFKEIYRVQRAMNGVAVVVPKSQLAAIRNLPGVTAVRPIVPSVPTSNSSAAFVGAPQVWEGTPAQADGTGITIGIIDTGVDFQHSNFGGTGLLADYQNNDRVTLTNITFPTAKVAGGFDFVGDAYDGCNAPAPDPNPTDCYGHGSHVAGIAGGYGVNPDGSTFAGPYDTSLPTTLRIQPGIAPKATLYSLKVFGCQGSTGVVVEAIDWALDPNNDGDLSDHLDVINMSLGSAEGGLTSLDGDASNAAALSGMAVVASAGNAGDSYFVAGNPGNAARVISVAASVDGGETLFVLAITAPAPANYDAIPAAFGPAIPPGVISGDLAYATPTNGCGVNTPLTGVSGKVALIDRGVCSFQTKVHNAELGGATGVIVANNQPGIIIMGGDATVAPVTIASAMISQADGTVIKGQLVSGTVTGSVGPGASLGDTMASFSSRGPLNDVPTALKPNITAPGSNIVSTQTGMTCVTGGGCIVPTASGFDPDNQSLTISGTSMAAPAVAGMVALLRQLHPTYSVEELKALAMNASLHDLTTLPGGAGSTYGAGRVGSGRIDAELAANLSVAAFNADGSGTVALSFPSAITGNTTVTRMLRIKNFSSTPQTFTLGIDTVVDNPGVDFSLPSLPVTNQLTVHGHETIDIPVKMSASANLLTHTAESTIAAAQTTIFGLLPRYWQTEETAYVNFDTGAGTMLRVPLYVGPNPTSAMTGGASVPTGGLAAGTANIPLSGTPVCTGAFTPGPPATCAGSFPLDEVSLVTPFELQVSNPRSSDPTVTADTNLRYAGVNVDVANDALNFGIAMWGPTGAPFGTTFPFGGTPVASANVTIVAADLTTPLFVLYPASLIDNSTNQDPTNVYVTTLFDLSALAAGPEYFANQVDPSVVDTRVFQNDVYFLTSTLTDLGLTGTETIHYFVDTIDSAGNTIDHLGPFTYNLAAPGLDFGSFGVLFEDIPGGTIPVDFNVANLNANGSLGALLLHHHNQPGVNTAEVLTVPPVTVTAPVFQSAVSERVHGAAGPFDLALSPNPSTPTIEPRQGPTQTLVFTFDRPVNGAVATVSEGTATAAAPTFSGNKVFVALSGVTDVQYVTVDLSAVSSTDGGTGGTGSARVGFLTGDVNQSKIVAVTDLVSVNAQLAKPLTAANFLNDVNVSGIISNLDKVIVNSSLAHFLP